MNKDEIKAAIHEAMDERGPQCFMTKDDQNVILDIAKVGKAFKGMITKGLAVFLLGGSFIALALIIFWKPITTWLTS